MPSPAAIVTSSLGGAHELAGHALVTILGLAQAHAGVATEEPAVVLRLGERAVLAGRGNLERIPLAVVAEQPGHALAQRQRHAIRMVDEQAQRGA